MNINYNDYPMLLFLLYDTHSMPDELPFTADSEAALKYIKEGIGFKQMLRYISICNADKKGNTTANYFIEDKLLQKIIGDDDFRKERLKEFLKMKSVKSKHGIILLPDRMQYVYLIFDKVKTKLLIDVLGIYVGVALLKNNFFIGYEEGVISRGKLKLIPVSYIKDRDISKYLLFVIISLMYAENKTLEMYHAPKVKEKIFILK